MLLFQLYLSMFFSFFKIGLFGFGGGYAMLPLIQQEVVVSNEWITVSEFTDIVAISQTTPGPISFNSATFIFLVFLMVVRVFEAYFSSGNKAKCFFAHSLTKTAISRWRANLFSSPSANILSSW